MSEEGTKHNKDDGNQTWHAMKTAEVLSALDADEKGLTKEEVSRRLDEYGPNELPSEEKPSALQRLLRQFKNVLIYVLLVAAAMTAVLGEWTDMAVILGVVLINAVIGFIQEGKAEKAMESIRGMLSPEATVLRDGEERQVPAEELVPGDIVLLGSGDRVPADIRVLETRNGQADEAALTGESEPVSKQAEPVEADAPLGDRQSMAYSSTMMTGGTLRGVVVATGSRAEIGRIGEMIAGVQEITTPLLRKIDSFGRWLAAVIVLISVALFLFGYLLRDFEVTEIFMAVVSLAVAAIPEGLPAIMTITLALGVQRMARHQAIIRRLPAVETLGSVTVICSDKTGTLTRNEMTVAKVAITDSIYSVSGSGYAPEGEFSSNGEPVSVDEHPGLLELARAGLLASDARLRQDEGQWHIEGTPTEGAAVVLAYKAGMNRNDEQQERPRLDVIPFESERRYMASLHKDPEGQNVAYIKGAPERVLEMCSNQRAGRDDEPADEDAWQQRAEELADSGHRVLAVATKRMGSDESLDENKLDGLTLLGLIGIIDPPREEAIDAVAKCRTAGIRVKMITGDHALTARSVGESMGIGDGTHAVTGKDLQSAEDDETVVNLVQDNDVFARFSPEHKLRMIEALQSQGQIVAMTGDGVNDAPSLKRADVGVAMGIKGSEAAKDAAHMVLADDNFATIERAVEEGRTIYDNLIKTILFMLPTNGAQSLVVVVSVLVLSEVMPISPLQILWVNMVTAVTLALAFAFEPPEENIMRRSPRPPREPILSRHLLWRLAFVSILIAAAAILHFLHRDRAGVSLEQARTVAVNTLVAAQLFYLFNSRFLRQSSLHLRSLRGNRAVFVTVAALVLLQLAFTYLGPMQTLFGTAGMTISEWIWAIASGVAVFLLVELEKAILRRWDPAT